MGTARQSPPSQELKIFSDRLQKAIEFKKIDLGVLAKESEYKPDDIHKLLTGMREPGFKKLTLLANSLGCSVDYLLGLTPEARRAGVVEPDVDVVNPQPIESGQTSGRLSNKAEQFIAMLPALMELDVELLTYIAGFLIERKEKRLSKFIDAVVAKPPKEDDSIPQISRPTNKDSFSEDDFDDADDLWDDVEDDEFEDDDWEDDCFDDDDFDDFDD